MNELDQLMRLADITGILSKNKKHHASPPPVIKMDGELVAL
jgi:hypothetical protein